MCCGGGSPLGFEGHPLLLRHANGVGAAQPELNGVAHCSALERDVPGSLRLRCVARRSDPTIKEKLEEKIQKCNQDSRRDENMSQGVTSRGANKLSKSSFWLSNYKVLHIHYPDQAILCPTDQFRDEHRFERRTR